MRQNVTAYQFSSIKHLAPVLLIVFGMLSCSLLSRNDLPEPELLHAGRIKNIDARPTQIQFEVIAVTPEPCWRYHSYEYDKSDNVVDIKIFGRRTTHDPCPKVGSSVEGEITIPVESGNTYTFDFHRKYGGSLDTTITIP